jgi:hypothetical protein
MKAPKVLIQENSVENLRTQRQKRQSMLRVQGEVTQGCGLPVTM